ncbi:MAG: 4-alpha-glucanotransferase [Actinomycetota bacterium]|nr:4-alpha-glucanotransferase [Actinomycetota bacterium]
MLTSYVDVENRRIRASRESLLSVLEALGAPISPDASSPREIGLALRARQRDLWRRTVEPVVVAWDGRLTTLRVRLPAGAAAGSLGGRLELEDGAVDTFRVDLDGAMGPAVRQRAEVDGNQYVSLDLRLGQRVPPGYHRLSVSAGRRRGEAVVIAAPRKAAEGPEAPRLWGAFAPLYALHSAHSLGIGDFRDLGDLQDWIGEEGGHFVATLPLFATFLDHPFEPSPYSPVTRRFWNDVFIDVASLPELETSAAAREALAEAAPGLLEAGQEPLVDYHAVAAAKRSVLAAAAGSLISGGGTRREELERFAAADPALDDYAAFRAFGEAFRGPWQEWPDEARAGRLAPSGVPEDARNYHRYVQFVASGQLAAARRSGAGLMLDLPLGVHPAGYDVWRERGAFLPRCTAGAPPDPMNAKGQDWGNPPLHPEGIRAGGYGYVIDSVRRLMARSGVLRIDHVMGLHRLFVIPPGHDASEGVYIRYRAEENYAVLCLESQRSDTMVVGEDLGTVPAECRRAMRAHRVYGCHVARWGIREDGLEPPPPTTVASIGTHDMPPFAAWWRGLDITERLELGLITEEHAARDTAERERDRKLLVRALVRQGLLTAPLPGVDPEAEVLTAWLAFLARSDARAVLVFLEELWGETHSQNIPGTVNEHPNWRRRIPYPLEAIRSMPEVVGRLKLVHDLRTRAETVEEGTTWRSR